ncbi:MAG: DUF4399 domain-containing protein [Caldilineaceae bacterium]
MLYPIFVPSLKQKFALLLLLIATIALVSACGSSDDSAEIPTTVPTLSSATNTPVPPTATIVPATSTATASASLDQSNALSTTIPVSPTEVTSATASSAVRVFFRQPTSNAILPITSTIIAGSQGISLENGSQLHLLLDAPFAATGETIPSDAAHLLLASNELTASVVLTPGLHLLRLQLSDSEGKVTGEDGSQAEIPVRVAAGAPEQSVRFVEPTNFATVPPTFTVVMAATGLIVEPAGDVHENAGHMHILIDKGFVASGEAVPKDATDLHFGQGQLTATLTLPVGEHQLLLQFANGAHVAMDGAQYRDTITVTVAEQAPAAQVQIVEPKDGAEVSSPFTVTMAVAGMILEPAGAVIEEGRGHLHLLIDSDFIPAGQAIPKDETHLHFGLGQTQATLTLPEGEHTIRLQMANGAHIALEGDQYRYEIKVKVTK